jgi:AraC family transcriptional regulator
MKSRIELLPEKKLVGMHLSMSFADNKTGELWRSFMPHRNKIQHPVSADLFSMQVFPVTFNFGNINPHEKFEKWAAIEVVDFSNVPEGMETFLLPQGLYAVFLHKGAAQTAQQTFQFIFGIWLPASGYSIDARPHFEILGEKYKNNDPESEEEIWIPVKE